MAVNPTAAKPDTPLQQSQIIASIAKLGGAVYVVTACLQAPSQGTAQQRGRRRQQQIQLVEEEAIAASGTAGATAAAVAAAQQSCSRMLVLVDTKTVSPAAAARLRRRWPGSELLLMGYLSDCVSCYQMLPTDSYIV